MEENLRLQGYLYGINSKEVDKRVPELLKIVELEDKRKELVKNLSGGMKRRLQIARSLISNPKLVFLDEPTTGLSPETRKELWEYIKSLKNKGISLLLTRLLGILLLLFYLLHLDLIMLQSHLHL